MTGLIPIRDSISNLKPVVGRESLSLRTTQSRLITSLKRLPALGTWLLRRQFKFLVEWRNGISSTQAARPSDRSGESGHKSPEKNLPGSAKEFALYLVTSLLIVFALTELGGGAASNLPPNSTRLIQQWMKQGPESRFDDWMDGVVLANVLYKSIDSRHSIWTYYGPSTAPPGGWDVLAYVLSPGNREALSEALRTRQGNLLHRYWTGHIALTALALYVYTDPAVASKVTLTCVLFSMLLFALAWTRRCGLGGALCMAVMLLGSGVIYAESFHTHAWGLAWAFAAAAYTAKRLAAGRPYVAPAVVAAVFANWVGYDYVFPTLALCLPLFLSRENGDLHIEGLGAPFKFTMIFFAVTALMMVLRVPVAYFFENCPPSEFLTQLTERLTYRLHGEYLPQEMAAGAEISRRVAILSALPAVNSYLFNLGGRFAPMMHTVGSYVAFQALPIVTLAGILAARNRQSQLKALKPVVLVASSVLLFHLVLIVLVNHACVHPWMHARYMVLSLALSWATVVSALAPAELLHRLSARFSRTG